MPIIKQNIPDILSYHKVKPASVIPKFSIFKTKPVSKIASLFAPNLEISKTQWAVHAIANDVSVINTVQHAQIGIEGLDANGFRILFVVHLNADGNRPKIIDNTAGFFSNFNNPQLKYIIASFILDKTSAEELIDEIRIDMEDFTHSKFYKLLFLVSSNSEYTNCIKYVVDKICNVFQERYCTAAGEIKKIASDQKYTPSSVVREIKNRLDGQYDINYLRINQTRCNLM